MDARNILLNFLDDMIKELEGLDDTDIAKLNSGDFTVSLKIVRRQTVATKAKNTSDQDFNKILEELTSCKDREIGYKVLSSYSLNKKELELFAKSINVHIMKTDKIEKIRDKLIEATIGATLRSIAIQGKET
ncbi:MAG: hypothetical protein RLZZ422_916 [Pseudomonadota bacterium]|jgi:hypothetical protein